MLGGNPRGYFLNDHDRKTTESCICPVLRLSHMIPYDLTYSLVH